MKTCDMPFYLLQGTIFRTQEDLNNLIEINEVFSDESLIDARHKAFHKFQSYLDVFLESAGYKYKSYSDTLKKLDDFVSSHRIEFALNNQKLGQIDSDFDKGLFLYFVTDPSDTYTTKEGVLIYNQKFLIHFIKADFDNYWKAALNGLQKEAALYKAKNYKTNNELQPIKLKQNKTFNILKSPINYQKIIDNEFRKTTTK